MLPLIEVNDCRLSVSLNVHLETTLTNQVFINENIVSGLDLKNALITCNPESSVIQFAGLFS
jgi:hypothetical protein